MTEYPKTGMCGRGVGFSFPINLEFYGDAAGLHLNAEQREGCLVPFTVVEKKKKYYEGTVQPFYMENGYTNCCEALLRGEKDLTAMKMKGSSSSYTGSYVIELGDGVRRHYSGEDKFYLLRIEERANGNLRHFSYEDKKHPKYPTRIWTTNKNQTLILNWMNFEHGKKELKVTASNGEKVRYQLGNEKGITTVIKNRTEITKPIKLKLLRSIEGKHIYPVHYDSRVKNGEFESAVHIPKVKRPDGRILSLKYDSDDRVKSIFLGDLKKPIYTFEYHKNYTVLTDAHNNTSRYDYNKKKRIEKITQPHRSHDYDWSTSLCKSFDLNQD